VKHQSSYLPKLSIFNKVIGDSHFELEFASWLDTCPDEIFAFSKNYYRIEFKIDYQNTDGSVSHYYPDFFVKTKDAKVYIIELKGREDLDDVLKIQRLVQYCRDVNQISGDTVLTPLYIKEYDWAVYRPNTFRECLDLFEIGKGAE
jgi:type III restriction enzyme